MISEKLIRQTLRLSFVFNILAACMLVFSDNTLARMAGFTVSTSPIHTALAALMVAGLGLAYGWLAQQPVIDQPLLTFGALIKASAFFTFVGQWLFDAVSTRFVMFAVVDIVLAIIWLSWVRQRKA